MELYFNKASKFSVTDCAAEQTVEINTMVLFEKIADLTPIGVQGTNYFNKASKFSVTDCAAGQTVEINTMVLFEKIAHLTSIGVQGTNFLCPGLSFI